MQEKTDYTQLSDFEINRLVAEVVYNNPYEITKNIGDDSIQVVDHHIGGRFMKTPIDYCNNPSDIMPIAIENKISLISDEHVGGWYATSDFHNFIEPWGKADFDKNPYRAIAICYIKMQEAKQ